MRVAELHQARAFGVLGDAALEGDGAHFVELAFGGAHSGFFPVIFRILGRLVTTWGAWRKGKWPVI
jgi:hypothetical protein